MRQSRSRTRHVALLMSGIGAVLVLGCSDNRPGGVGLGSGGARTGSGGSATAGSGGTAGETPGDTGGMGAPIGPTFVDGTRLVAQTYSFPGTAPLFVGIFDRQEKVACAFRAASDGQLRCLPPSKLNVPDPPPADRWLAGSEVAVAATGLRLRQHRIVALDGSSFPNWISGELMDDSVSEPCSPDTTREKEGTGEGVCLPRYALATGIFFADASCTVPVAQPFMGPMPLIVATPKRELFALGEKVGGTIFTQYASGGACTEFPAGSGDFYRVGAPLPAQTVATVRIAPRGTGRLMLQTVEFEGAGVAHVRHDAQSSPYAGQGPYYDRSLALLCRPTWTVSGELRCVPDDAYYVSETWLTNFADPDCTQPVVNSSMATFAVVLRRDDTQGRQVVVEVRKLGTEYTRTAYTRENSPTRECHEYLKGAGYPLGEVVPTDSFAAVEARTGQE